MRTSAPTGRTVSDRIARGGNFPVIVKGAGFAAGISNSSWTFVNPGASNTATYRPGLSVTRVAAGRLAG